MLARDEDGTAVYEDVESNRHDLANVGDLEKHVFPAMLDELDQCHARVIVGVGHEERPELLFDGLCWVCVYLFNMIGVRIFKYPRKDPAIAALPSAHGQG